MILDTFYLILDTWYFLLNVVDFQNKKHTNFINYTHLEILSVWRKMHTRKFFWKWKENTFIIIGAALVAFGIFFVSKNPEFFSASVLSLQEKAFIIEKWRDIGYKTNSWYVDIFISENLETPQSIDFMINFDKDTVNIDAQNISGQGTRTVNMPDDTSIIIKSIPNENIDKNQSIIVVPFIGDIEDILLSEAVAILDNGKEKNLSIGSLNDSTSHSNK